MSRKLAILPEMLGPWLIRSAGFGKVTLEIERRHAKRNQTATPRRPGRWPSPKPRRWDSIATLQPSK
jgi:hypothetical protein